MGPHPAVAAIRLAVRHVLHDILNDHRTTSEAPVLSEQAPHAIQMLATIYANHNMRAEVSALLKLLEAEPPRRNPYTVAMLHLKLGDREAGLRWLGIACEERTPQIAFLRWQIRVPAFNSIRDDARFNQIVRCGERRSN